MIDTLIFIAIIILSYELAKDILKTIVEWMKK